MSHSWRVATLFGLEIVAERMTDWWPRFWSHLKTSSRPLVLYTPNPEIMVRSWHQPEFHRVLTQADILIPDGIGLIWASRWLQWRGRIATDIPERITGTDLVIRLLDAAAQEEWKVLIIGGQEYLPSASTSTERSTQPGFVQQLTNLPGSVWWTSGYARVAAPTQAEQTQISQALKAVKPAIVLVAFGAPYQEQWVQTHLSELSQHSVRLTMTVGGAIDFLQGKALRAPEWLRALGLEWFWRLCQQPWRWRRQLGLLAFLARVART
jgi:N-acetylglucosaminyldiphosphoundecaprenol N-acetyl-beta-D-mannosaminyltransferase